ncbi:MAG: hypothetical protein CMM58_00975 [Rhodospirillaceae bacterium]|nr:hypothetical protein [Rhodospirillaceae bacterium]|tara:strand:- start:115 stop:771 length:657 start_codon:yes stop_codon:yes gene_type:complete
MGEMWMHPTDIAIIIIILISGFLSFFRGFSKEVLSIIAWLAAFLAGIFSAPYLSPELTNLLPNITYAPWITGICVGLLVLIFVSLISLKIQKKIYLNELTAINRSLGFLFGLIRGFLIVCLSFIAIQWLLNGEKNPEWISNSKSFPLIQNSVRSILKLVPMTVRGTLKVLEPVPEQKGKANAFEQLNLPPIKQNKPLNESGYSKEQRKLMKNTIENIK